MPRPRQTQPIEVPSGQPYGERKAQEESLAQVGMPDNAAMNQAMLHQAAMQGAEAMPAPPAGGIMGQPSMRPTEPLTAGMSIGAGPGPEALRGMNHRQNLTQKHLQMAAEISGNPKLAEMAGRANRPIGRQLPRGRPSAP